MCILTGFNYPVEQRKEKLHLFQVSFKTSLTEMKRKKLTPMRSLGGMYHDVKASRTLQDIHMIIHREKNVSRMKCEHGGQSG